MLELHAVRTNVVGCYAKAAALDRLVEGAQLAIRVAPDELLRFGDLDRIDALEGELSGLDEHGIVFDVSSAFAAWSLRGDGRFEAFCRLSQLELPEAPAVIQGSVAHVPAKIVVRDDELLVIVTSVLSHHLRERVLAACADLQPSEHEAVSA